MPGMSLRDVSVLVLLLASAASAQAADAGMLYVLTEPEGATVLVDGEERGKTPVLVRDLEPGLHLLELRHADFATMKRLVTVRPGKVARAEIDFQDAPASLTVATDPFDATVFLDKRELGKAPLTVENLMPGQHELVVCKEDFARVEQELTLKPGENRVLDVKLAAGKCEWPSTARSLEALLSRFASPKLRWPRNVRILALTNGFLDGAWINGTRVRGRMLEKFGDRGGQLWECGLRLKPGSCVTFQVRTERGPVSLIASCQDAATGMVFESMDREDWAFARRQPDRDFLLGKGLSLARPAHRAVRPFSWLTAFADRRAPLTSIARFSCSEVAEEGETIWFRWTFEPKPAVFQLRDGREMKLASEFQSANVAGSARIICSNEDGSPLLVDRKFTKACEVTGTLEFDLQTAHAVTSVAVYPARVGANAFVLETAFKGADWRPVSAALLLKAKKGEPVRVGLGRLVLANRLRIRPIWPRRSEPVVSPYASDEGPAAKYSLYEVQIWAGRLAER